MSPIVNNPANLIIARNILPFLDDLLPFAQTNQLCFKHVVISMAIGNDGQCWEEFTFHLRVTLPTEPKIDLLSLHKIFTTFVFANIDPVIDFCHQKFLKQHPFSLRTWQQVFKRSMKNLEKNGSIRPRIAASSQNSDSRGCDSERAP